jgi:hypothetical protein
MKCSREHYRYFRLNGRKFISLWRLANRLDAKLYLVNYSKGHATKIKSC